jgi:(p)ppGpp synthase/HD superfamily hydrolase
MIKKGELLDIMLVLVTNKFSGKFDKGGQPYVLHCLKVMHYTKTDDEELQCIALGHDLIEDTNVSYGFLRQVFNDRIADGIMALTKIDGQTPEEYLAGIKANKDAIHVKLADLRHNSDIRRLKGVRPKDIERVIKYHTMYQELKDLV